jgi:hypothetical protein
VLFAASLGLIAVASTGLWASIDCLLVAGHEYLDLLIALARFTTGEFWAKFPD